MKIRRFIIRLNDGGGADIRVQKPISKTKWLTVDHRKLSKGEEFEPEHFEPQIGAKGSTQPTLGILE